MLAIVGLVAEAPAWAQGSDEWSFVLTPQVWLSHIAKNGFVGPPSDAAVVGGFGLLTSAGDFLSDPFPSQSSPKNYVNPQWGLQLAAQKGRWTLAGAFQVVDFQTYNDSRFVHPEGNTFPGGVTFCLAPPPQTGTGCVSSGQRWAREVIDTTRIDIDVAASYFFPDVVQDWLDASVGGGFKLIYASAKRRYTRLSPAAAFLENTPHGNTQTTGLYTTCGDPCNPFVFRNEVKQRSYLYGLTVPVKATAHLNRDATWMLPLGVAPMVGVETRDDYGVVYRENLPQNVQQFRTPLSVNRLDGTTFAYGVTADAAVRWSLTEALSAYAGMRVQYIKGHETFLAYGPLLGMSYRFGAR